MATKTLQGFLTEGQHRIVKGYAVATNQTMSEALKDFVWSYLDEIKTKLEDGQEYIVHSITPETYRAFAKLVGTGKIKQEEPKRIRVAVMLVDEEIVQYSNWIALMQIDITELFSRACMFNNGKARERAIIQEAFNQIKETQNS